MLVLLFVGTVEIEKGLDVRPMGKAARTFHLLQLFTRLIPPAAFGQE
jgi:hypothetical protein